jgi:hypothetical protein
MIMAVRRYPGVQPFGDDDIQRELFRGRDEEQYELLQLVLAERLVLLFARSGIGKSSLINAGLLHSLRERGYFPMVVRVSGSPEGPIASLYEGIRAAATDAQQRWQIASEPDEASWNRTSLWHFFKTSSFWRGPKLLHPVLVIDQFEELFTLYSAAERRQLVDELSDLVRGTRPRDHADREAPGLSDAPPEVKVVLALREDFYAQLEELRQRIPAIYKAPFRLGPLSREKARHAIVEPAGLEDDDLSVPPFEWSDDAVTKVLDFLSEQQMGEGRKQIGDEIEPFQLQLICQHVEDLVGEEGLDAISTDHLGGDEGLTRVLSSFYERSLAKICDKFRGDADLRPRLEKLCEYGFITARGRRLLREESTIMQEDGVSPEILRELVELRLLRKEPRVGDNYYELTHDTLIEPIKLSRLEREQREARAREEQRAREALEHAERERQLKRRVQIAAAGALLLLVVGGAAWVHADRQRAAAAEQAEARARQAQQAEAAARRAQATAQQAEKAQQAAVQQAEKAATVAGEAVLQAEKATTVASEAVLQAKRVEINAQLTRLQEEQIRARQQVQEAEAIAKGGGEEARLQFEQAKAHLAQIERQAAQQIDQLNAAERTVADKQQQAKATDRQMAQADSEDVERQLEEVKQSLGQIEKTAQIQEAAPMSEEVIEEEILQDGAAEAAVQEVALDTESAPASEGAVGQEPSASGGAMAESAQAQESTAGAFGQFRAAFSELSLCEKFDALASFEPDRPFGEQAEFRLVEQERLRQLGDQFPIVVTQSNLVAGPTVAGPARTAWQECEALPPGRALHYDPNTTVCIYSWLSYAGHNGAAVVIEILDPNGKSILSRLYGIDRNPLMGERLGYRIWTGKFVSAPGEHQILIYDPNVGKEKELICQTRFDIE